MAKQKKHIRRSKKGKAFVAGSKKKSKLDVSEKMRKAVIKEHTALLAKELKRSKRVRLPELGILRIKIKKASKGGKTVTAFGKTYVTKPKPRRAMIKFSAAKNLKELVN